MELNRRLLLAGAAASTMAGAAGGDAMPQMPAALIPFVDQARKDVQLTMASHGIVGAAASLLVDGEPVWVECFGETGGPASRPIDRDTIFSLQSTSKNFCATAIMLAVQRGLLDLDRPLSDDLPDFNVNSRFEPQPVSQMSLRRLLSHHAGFTHEAPVGNNFIPASPSFEAHVRSIQDTWLRYPVGERYAYSNLGIDLAGYVLERAAGMPYAECLKAWLFGPLAMHSTTASADVYEPTANRAIGHAVGFEHVPVRIPIIPSGGVYTSISDISRYTQFHLSRGRVGTRQVLDERLWQEMHEFRYGDDYALCVARFENRFRDRDVTVYGHNGGGFGFGSCYYYCPSEGLAWIVLFNGVTKSDQAPLFDPVMPQPLLAARYGPLAATGPNTNPIQSPPLERLQSRVGLWMNGEARCHASLDDGALGLLFEGEAGMNRLTFITDDDAWMSDGPRKGGRVRFHAAEGLLAQHFELPEGMHWDFIDGPSVAPGPVRSEYDGRLGDYEIYSWGKPVYKITLSKRNGYLYANDIRASPFIEGLFFSGLGENLDLRGSTPTVRSIQLVKTAA
jgi:CubicO group peptidase (beta-lactamase class C family)